MSEEESLLTPNAALLELDDDDDELFVKPKKKHKILMLSDHQLAPSGVGVQARFLIEKLIETGRYSFRCLGGAIKHQDYNTIKVNDDFFIKPVDNFGTKEMIREILLVEKPDAIMLFTDPRQFTWLWEMEDEIHQVCPISYWHVWDNDPYPAFNTPWYESTDLINCLSYKTYELVKANFPEKTNYIPHAFPRNIYYPLQKDEVENLKKDNFGDRKDWFKALWVNRNATRKVPSDVLDCWNVFLNDLEKKYGHRNALLVMHTDPKDKEGPDLLAVAQALGLQNHVWFSTQKLDFKHMNILHNTTDCCVNISKNEGFGLSTLISLQVGKPVIALSTGGEIRKAADYRDGSPNGVALKPAKRLLVGSQQVPYIYEDYADTQETADAFMKIFEMTEEEKVTLAKKMSDYVDFEFNFDDVANKWDETLEKCIVDFKAKKEQGLGDWKMITINPIVKMSDAEQKNKVLAAVAAKTKRPAKVTKVKAKKKIKAKKKLKKTKKGRA